MTPATAVRRSVTAYVVAGSLVFAVLAGVLALAGVNILWAASFGLVVGVATSGLLYFQMGATVLRAIGAQPLPAGSQPRLVNVVDGLCVANGFRMPELHIIDDLAPNMVVVGRHPRHAALAITTGALDQLGVIELEGAIAHELTRMRNRITLAEGTAATLILRPLGFAPTLATKLSERLFDPRTPAELDVESVGLTRYPPGLAAALRTLQADGREPRLNPKSYRHLWLNPPAGAMAPQDFTLAERVEVLEQF